MSWLRTARSRHTAFTSFGSAHVPTPMTIVNYQANVYKHGVCTTAQLVALL